MSGALRHQLGDDYCSQLSPSQGKPSPSPDTILGAHIMGTGSGPLLGLCRAAAPDMQEKNAPPSSSFLPFPRLQSPLIAWLAAMS